jgi:hypothetical protein
MKTITPFLVALAIQGFSACDAADNIDSGTPLSGDGADRAYATLKEHCTFTRKEDGWTEDFSVELDKARKTLRFVHHSKEDATPKFAIYRDVIVLRNIDPTEIKVLHHGGIQLQPIPGRKAMTQEIVSPDNRGLPPTENKTCHLAIGFPAYEYTAAAALRELVQAAQSKDGKVDVSTERPAQLTDLLAGTHWTWYEGDFTIYAPRLRYWVEFYKDGTARVPWRDVPQVWKVTEPDTVTVSDPKLGDNHTFRMNVLNKSGSTESGKLHIRYRGKALNPARRAGDPKAPADMDAAFADVKAVFAHTTTIEGLTATTTMELDKASSLLTEVHTEKPAGGSREVRRVRITMDLRHIDPASIKVQGSGIRLEPYPGRKAIWLKTYGFGIGLPARDLTYHHLHPDEPTQAEGAAAAFRELVESTQEKAPAQK